MFLITKLGKTEVKDVMVEGEFGNLEEGLDIYQNEKFIGVIVGPTTQSDKKLIIQYINDQF